MIIYHPSLEGKNTWDFLPAAFPSSTKMEIVSYSCNVFMLRKMAKQNRSKSVNLDGDYNEWEKSKNENVNSKDGT